MMKTLEKRKNFLFFICVIGILALFGVGVWFLVNDKKPKDNSLYSVYIGEQEYVLEIADSDIERQKGLGGRYSLCEECGMLFIFERSGNYAFWMKDMRFPLDIVWLLGDKVVFIANDISPNFSGVIDPGVFADRVVEVNAGVAGELRIGEKLKFQ